MKLLHPLVFFNPPPKLTVNQLTWNWGDVEKLVWSLCRDTNLHVGGSPKLSDWVSEWDFKIFPATTLCRWLSDSRRFEWTVIFEGRFQAQGCSLFSDGGTWLLRNVGNQRQIVTSRKIWVAIDLSQPSELLR
jgi:hypothetical protein